MNGFDVRADSSNQTPAPDWNKDSVWLPLALPQNLVTDGALSGYNKWIIKRMDKDKARFRYQRITPFLSLRKGVPLVPAEGESGPRARPPGGGSP